jgi:polyhydroxyalkanoate synthesis regulator phasin
VKDKLLQASQNRTALAEIKRKYDTGEISRDEAKQLSQPILARINNRSAEIAKKYGKKNYPKLDFINAMRNNY